MGPWGTPGLPSVPVLAMFKVLRLSHALSNQGIGSSLPMTSLGGVLMRFSRMFVGFFLLVHWFACTFYAVATITGEAEDPYLARLAALAPWERYVIELYNALSMMLGERMDGEPDARRAAVAMVAMLTGALVVAAVFGNVAVLITSINMSETRLQEKMDRINESMSTCRLPLELQAVIRQYYLYSWARHKESASSMFVEQRCQTLASAQCPSSAPTPPLKRRAPGVSGRHDTLRGRSLATGVETTATCSLSGGCPSQLPSQSRRFHALPSKRSLQVEDLCPALRRKVRLALYRDVLVAVPIFKPLGEAELEMLALSVNAEIYNPDPSITVA